MPSRSLYELFAYIDPTGGLPPSVWGLALAAVLGALSTGLAVLRYYGRAIWAFIRRHGRISISVVVFLVGASLLAFWYEQRPTRSVNTGRKVLILGLDGLDPQLLNQYLAEGRLPNLARLARAGLYHPLITTSPPQSPVAWSSFLTGTAPSEHGVYDFIKRDPKTYMPDLAIADRMKMRLPWAGRPFWEGEGGGSVKVVAQRVPLTFPPPKLDGRLLAGMGVWDARGTEGTYFYFSTRPVAEKDARGMIFNLRREGAVHKGEIPGPYFFGQSDTLREPFELEIAGVGADFRVQGRSYPLRQGRWSDWVRMEFPRGPLQLQKLKVITRVYWKTKDGQETLYVSPLNFDPAEPLYAISHPKSYAGELAEALGPYHTRGMPFDTQALTDGVLSEEAFLDHCRLISQESEAMLFHELSQFREGVLFAYFEAADIIQHMFWRAIDPENPLHKLAETAQYKNVIPEAYEQCDALVGRAWAALGKDGALVVLSDHGFAPFRKAIHLNAVLRDRGFLHIKESAKTSGEFFKDVDWARTRAYAVGFNSIYLNIAGREAKGLVSPEAAPALMREIAEALENFKDGGSRPILNVYETDPISTGAEGADRPDLIVGYARGYRVSWETALGGVPEKLLEPNTKKWSGDHCIDSGEVPGIFLSSDPTLDAESLTGVGPRIVQYLRRP